MLTFRRWVCFMSLSISFLILITCLYIHIQKQPFSCVLKNRCFRWISPNSLKKPVLDSHFGLRSATLLKKRLRYRCSREFCEVLKNILLAEHLWATGSIDLSNFLAPFWSGAKKCFFVGWFLIIGTNDSQTILLDSSNPTAWILW